MNRIIISILVLSVTSTLPVAASALTQCVGEAPDWKLGLGTETADLNYKQALRFDVPHSTTALNRDWPRAYTLVGQNATAIVILDQDACRIGAEEFPISADILTQDGSAAIMLTGCCRANDE